MGDFQVIRDSMVTPVTTAGGGIYREGDDDEGDYSPGNIAKTTGLRWAHYCCTVGVLLVQTCVNIYITQRNHVPYSVVRVTFL